MLYKYSHENAFTVMNTNNIGYKVLRMHYNTLYMCLQYTAAL